MHLNYSKHIANDYLHVTTTGNYKSVAEAIALISKVYEDLSRSGLGKLLVDDTKCHVLMSLDESMELHASSEASLNIPKVPTAIVCKSCDYALYRHFYSAHLNTRVFTDLEAAETWIMNQDN